ncbi:response regulator [Rickettsiales bacterium]|nr:response regulator [Rickettsiales bacterium]
MSAHKIFIVEDNELNLKLFRDILESCDFDVSCTKDGLEAFKMMQSIMPDLIIMDIQLHGISGLDLIKQAKSDEHMKHIPIIAVTAFAMPEDRKKILNSGCNSYIAKPISIDTFIREVRRYLTA